MLEESVLTMQRIFPRRSDQRASMLSSDVDGRLSMPSFRQRPITQMRQTFARRTFSLLLCPTEISERGYSAHHRRLQRIRGRILQSFQGFIQGWV